VFIENVTDHRLLDQIARETGAKIGGTLDALSDAKGPAAYLDMFRPQHRDPDCRAVVLGGRHGR
jgi:ABC-type Zn uptake system ZnuABC Zn-binding protein ZnuA